MSNVQPHWRQYSRKAVHVKGFTRRFTRKRVRVGGRKTT